MCISGRCVAGVRVCVCVCMSGGRVAMHPLVKGTESSPDFAWGLIYKKCPAGGTWSKQILREYSHRVIKSDGRLSRLVHKALILKLLGGPLRFSGQAGQSSIPGLAPRMRPTCLGVGVF